MEFQKIFIHCPQKGLQSKIKKNKGRYEALVEFPEGWGVLREIPSIREVWIFSGITHGQSGSIFKTSAQRLLITMRMYVWVMRFAV